MAFLSSPDATVTAVEHKVVTTTPPDDFFLSILNGAVENVLDEIDSRGEESLNKKLKGHNCPPLGLAARYGHTELVEALLARDPDLIGEVSAPPGSLIISILSMKMVFGGRTKRGALPFTMQVKGLGSGSPS